MEISSKEEKSLKKLETSLISALQEGDKTKITLVYEQIYNEYYKLLFFVIGKYISDSETIKDLINDTFLNFFNNSTNVNGSIKSYLTRSAHNIALNYIKKNNKLSLIENDDLIGVNSDTANLSYNEIVSSLLKILSYKEVGLIIDHVVFGYTFKELETKYCNNAKNLNKAYERTIKKYRKENKNEKG